MPDIHSHKVPTLLSLASARDAVAHILTMLEIDERQALRLAHPELRDAIDAVTSTLVVNLRRSSHVDIASARPAPQRWPELRSLTIIEPDLEAIKALASGRWNHLVTLDLTQGPALGHRWRLRRVSRKMTSFNGAYSRALSAALRMMPELAVLTLHNVQFSVNSGATLFRALSMETAPQMHVVRITDSNITPLAVRMMATTGWRLQEIDMAFNSTFGAACVAALIAAPTFAIRRINLQGCSLNAAALLSLANAPWPLQELNISRNNMKATDAGPALAALSRHRDLRRLDIGYCSLSAAGFKALVEATWPMLTTFVARGANVEFEGPYALSSTAFAGFPAVRILDLFRVSIGEVGAQLLSSQRWECLVILDLQHANIGIGGARALARGAWPMLKNLDLYGNGLSDFLSLADVRRWIPNLHVLNT